MYPQKKLESSSSDISMSEEMHKKDYYSVRHLILQAFEIKIWKYLKMNIFLVFLE
jgi:hypothetical protein